MHTIPAIACRGTPEMGLPLYLCGEVNQSLWLDESANQAYPTIPILKLS